ncbi:hypothetical protein XENTR_v10022531 [Xenopus tropicalis]|nr:hypothetical protein XENTR_v10022531 [Xenopus tropicalis]
MYIEQNRLLYSRCLMYVFSTFAMLHWEISPEITGDFIFILIISGPVCNLYCYSATECALSFGAMMHPMSWRFVFI